MSTGRVRVRQEGGCGSPVTSGYYLSYNPSPTAFSLPTATAVGVVIFFERSAHCCLLSAGLFPIRPSDPGAVMRAGISSRLVSLSLRESNCC